MRCTVSRDSVRYSMCCCVGGDGHEQGVERALRLCPKAEDRPPFRGRRRTTQSFRLKGRLHLTRRFA